MLYKTGRCPEHIGFDHMAKVLKRLVRAKIDLVRIFLYITFVFSLQMIQKKKIFRGFMCLAGCFIIDIKSTFPICR